MFLKIMILLILSTTSNENFKVKTKTKKEKNFEIAVKVINDWAKKFKIRDKYLILAMIKQETDFKNMIGNDGEIGFLQVIPSEEHIKHIAHYRYSCYPDEIKDCTFTGRRYVPNIFYINRKGEKKVSTYKLRKFLLKHKKAGIAIGIGELAFWKKKYQTKLKRKFWKRFPYWYYKKKNVKIDKYEYWWYKVKKIWNDKIFFVHYNYGARLKTSKIGYYYPLNIYKYYKKYKKENIFMKTLD